MSDPERTADGHHIVVDGRRWRATDPHIPENLRKELVAELMDARRAVKTDDTARSRVHDAKVALGERGEPWWDDATAEGRAERSAATIRTLLRHRADTSSICPSDVARVAGGRTWRTAMDDVRRTARAMQDEGTVRITRKGEEVDPTAGGGPVRISRGAGWPG